MHGAVSWPKWFIIHFVSLLCTSLDGLLLLLLLLHLRANQEPPGRICESKDPFRFFLRVGRTVVRALQCRRSTLQ